MARKTTISKKTSRTTRSVGSPNRGGRTSRAYDLSRRSPNTATPNKLEHLTDARASRSSSTARGSSVSYNSAKRSAQRASAEKWRKDNFNATKKRGRK